MPVRAVSRSLPSLLEAVGRGGRASPRYNKASQWTHSELRCSNRPQSAAAISGLQMQYRQTQYSFFSTEEKTSMSFSPLEWWRNRQESKEAEKYKERILSMADQEVFVVGDMLKELDEVNKSWMAKLPGLSSHKETQMAKQMHKTLSGLAKVAGTDAASLENLTRKDKLKAALLGETTVDEINIVIKQFQVMTLMHRVVRKRKLEGKTIPTTAEGIQALMQQDAIKLLSKAQKMQLGKDQARQLMRKRR